MTYEKVNQNRMLNNINKSKFSIDNITIDKFWISNLDRVI